MLSNTAAGFHAVRLFRVADAAYRRGWGPLAGFVSLMNRIVFGVEITPGATLGPGLTIMHGNGIVIHHNARAGAGLSIYQGVSLVSDPLDAAPRIGENVTLFPGCILIGPVEVGDGAVINANAVVTKNVEPGGFVVGVNGRAERSGRDWARG